MIGGLYYEFWLCWKSAKIIVVWRPYGPITGYNIVRISPAHITSGGNPSSFNCSPVTFYTVTHVVRCLWRLSCLDGARTHKLKFHGSSFLVASSWHPREESVTRHEEIGRVGRGCYVDPCEDVRCIKSRVSCSWNLENDTTHGQTGSNTIHGSSPPADQSAKRGCCACRRECYEETAPVEFQLYAWYDHACSQSVSWHRPVCVLHGQ